MKIFSARLTKSIFSNVGVSLLCFLFFFVAESRAQSDAERLEAARAQITRIESALSDYQVLGLSPGASEADVKTAYRNTIFAIAPDRLGSIAPPDLVARATEAMKIVNRSRDRFRDGKAGSWQREEPPTPRPSRPPTSRPQQSSGSSSSGSSRSGASSESLSVVEQRLRATRSAREFLAVLNGYAGSPSLDRLVTENLTGHFFGLNPSTAETVQLRDRMHSISGAGEIIKRGLRIARNPSEFIQLVTLDGNASDKYRSAVTQILREDRSTFFALNPTVSDVVRLRNTSPFLPTSIEYMEQALQRVNNVREFLEIVNPGTNASDNFKKALSELLDSNQSRFFRLSPTVKDILELRSYTPYIDTSVSYMRRAIRDIRNADDLIRLLDPGKDGNNAYRNRISELLSENVEAVLKTTPQPSHIQALIKICFHDHCLERLGQRALAATTSAADYFKILGMYPESDLRDRLISATFRHLHELDSSISNLVRLRDLTKTISTGVEIIDFGLTRASTASQFVALTSVGPNANDRYRSAVETLIVRRSGSFSELSPSVAEIDALIRQCRSDACLMNIAQEGLQRSKNADEYLRIVDLISNRNVRDQAVVRSQSHFFSLNPSARNIRDLINKMNFIESSISVMREGAKYVRSAADLLTIVDPGRDPNLNYQTRIAGMVRELSGDLGRLGFTEDQVRRLSTMLGSPIPIRPGTAQASPDEASGGFMSRCRSWFASLKGR